MLRNHYVMLSGASALGKALPLCDSFARLPASRQNLATINSEDARKAKASARNFADSAKLIVARYVRWGSNRGGILGWFAVRRPVAS